VKMPPKSTPKGTPGSAKAKKVFHMTIVQVVCLFLYWQVFLIMPAGRHFVRMLLVLLLLLMGLDIRLENMIDLNMIETDGKLSL